MSAREQQSEWLIEYLDKSPNHSRAWLNQALHKRFGYRALEAAYLIYLIRNVYGSDVVVCRYSYRTSQWVYALASSAQEGQSYVARRVILIRGLIRNVIGIIDRIIAKFPDDDLVEVTVARTKLLAANAVLGEYDK